MYTCAPGMDIEVVKQEERILKCKRFHLEYNFISRPAVNENLYEHANSIRRQSRSLGSRNMRRHVIHACTQYQNTSEELKEEHLIEYAI